LENFLNEEIRKTGKENFRSCLPAFLIHLACSFVGGAFQPRAVPVGVGRVLTNAATARMPRNSCSRTRQSAAHGNSPQN
jgi:hypothetical protein